MVRYSKLGIIVWSLNRILVMYTHLPTIACATFWTFVIARLLSNRIRKDTVYLFHKFEKIHAVSIFSDGIYHEDTGTKNYRRILFCPFLVMFF